MRSAPEVSVVVLAFRATDLLDRCLHTLCLHRSETPFELIVVANGATREVLSVLERHRGVTVVRSRANRGFAGGCNLGASRAAGRYVVFLNDDAVVTDGWLDALVHTQRTVPGTGAVGSLVLAPSGAVLEFGSRILEDGHTEGLDRHAALADLEPLLPRRVDHASACSVLLERSFFDELGGFDEGFYPAYYEDTDLCRRIWRAGRAVIMNPASVIIHAESASTASAHRRVLFELGWRRFVDNWADQPDPVPAGLPAPIPPVVWVDDFVPRAAAGSGLARAGAAIEALTELGHPVLVHARDARFGVSAHLRSRSVAVLPALDPSRLTPPHAVVVSRPSNFDLGAAFARSWPDVPLIYDAEARFSARLETQLQLARPDDVRADVERELRDTLVLERRICAEADAVVTISEDEARWFRENGAVNVRVIDPFPNRCPVVDDDPGTARDMILFIAGWLSGPRSPNSDGLRWFADEVLPVLDASTPGLSIAVTGGAPPPGLLRLASDRLQFLGEVDDLEHLVDTARVVIAPIRFGAGVKNKVVDALSRAVPVVATTIGAEGIHPKWNVGLSVADEPAAFAAAVAALATDDTRWTAVRRQLLDVCRMHENDPSAAWADVVSDARRTVTRRVAR